VGARGTVFQPFLEQRLQRPVRGRGYAVSLGLHGLLALLFGMGWRHGESGVRPEAALAGVAVSLRAPAPRRLFESRARAAAAERPRRASPSLSHRPAAAPAVALAAASEPPASEPVAEAERDDQPGAVDRGEDAGGPLIAGSGGAGDDLAGGRRAGRRPVELFGRVVGGNRREVMGSHGLPYAPLKESTELRTYDVFPPLPAAQWPGDRPYVVVLDVCVSGDGLVSDVALVKPASQIFDPVVLEAVRTWRYKPRLVDGQAQAFCHVVAIKYEQL
jgi:hypothetical protein